MVVFIVHVIKVIAVFAIYKGDILFKKTSALRVPSLCRYVEAMPRLQSECRVELNHEH